MKKFILHIFCLLSTTFCLLYGLDWGYTKIYSTSTPRNKTQFLLQAKHKVYDIAFVGSSRVANHINTRLFDSLSGKKTINLGVEGADFGFNLLQLKLLLANNTVHKVCLQVDAIFELTTPSDIVIAEAIPYIKTSIIKEHLQQYYPYFYKLYNYPFYRYATYEPKIGLRELCFSIMHRQPKINLAEGFAPKFGNHLEGEEALPTTNLANNNDLNLIIQYCQQQHVALSLFIAPYSSKTKNLQYIDSLLQKVPNLINLTRGYPDSLFYDNAHLNNDGATQITTQLYDILCSKQPTPRGI